MSLLTDGDIAFLVDLLAGAGALALAMREGVTVQDKAQDDQVTAADLALSELLEKALAQRFPGDCIISEESPNLKDIAAGSAAEIRERVWLIDPIDGTRNYLLDDGQYCVMVGLLKNGRPQFGIICAPTRAVQYFGGPGYGLFKNEGGRTRALKKLENRLPDRARILMGARDRKKHPWVADLSGVTLNKMGSVGLKVAQIIEQQADLFIHLSRKLKTWDTAAPAALALAAGLDVGALEGDLTFPLTELVHDTSVIMGLPGSLDWCRHHLGPVLQKN